MSTENRGAASRRALLTITTTSALALAGALGAFLYDSPGAAARASTTPLSPASAPLSPAAAPAAPPLAALGKTIFFDPALSEPPGTSCASCHDPAHGYAGNHGSALGVARGSRPDRYAKRNTPSVLYLKFVRRFHYRWEEDAPLPDAVGGFFWDGRVDSLADLARQPLLNPDEMGNIDATQLASKIRTRPYAPDLARAAASLDSAEGAVGALGKAVEAFLLSDEMAPFSSAYDDYVRGKGALTPLEARGLALFKDGARGACASCHRLDDSSGDPERSPFSDFGFEAVGAPRNKLLPVNRDPKRFDLGLCQQHEHPHTDEARFCGSFRTPSLRNVATRAAFMHSGTFTRLRDVVAFYATRATDPRRWYGSPAPDDLPAAYRENVNDRVAPYDRAPGGPPALDEAEIDALVAFLGALTDAPFR
ncbi:MAG TPA: cytochrome c peroxidase [Polyangiaceae bacterium]|jgi:cytochrome c peroxidase